MKYTVALSIFTGLVAAQSATTTATSSSSTDLAGLVAQLPSCATSCLTKAASTIGCSATDFTCLCNSKDTLTSSLTTCILTAGCSTTEIATAAKVAPQICSYVEANPDSSAIASASNLLSGALATASATATASSASPATATTAAAVRPEMGFGMIGAAMLGAAML
ncbi:hypothetical protein CGCS363_v009134 [Colletotrichum siamense]|uniref:uncharacterized protein n=1 Tax=Colletotrichum siamense TaxID=690259 RepID=UPI001872A8DB|nr:uncharacterized protein CGCS363_v009134 [Colletotrichum siamense]KAF5494338.1 hypothetical protein CGCS363_v009134 [Colletotrichum siamense]